MFKLGDLLWIKIYLHYQNWVFFGSRICRWDNWLIAKCLLSSCRSIQLLFSSAELLLSISWNATLIFGEFEQIEKSTNCNGLVGNYCHPFKI